MSKAFLSEELVARLRVMACRGASIRAMVEEIRLHVGTDDGIVFAVTRYLKEAFFLTVGDVWEVGSSKCLGGKVHEDNEIDNLLLPVINRTRKQWDREFGKEAFENEQG